MATSSTDQRKIVIIDVPTEAGTHWPGQSKAPDALKNAGLVPKLEKLGYAISNISALDEVQHWQPTDITNGVRDEENTIKVVQKVADAVSSSAAQDSLLLVIGGDCTIEHGVLAGLNARHGERVGLVYFDGDADLTLPGTAGTGGQTGILDSMVLSHLLQREGGLESMKRFGRRDGSALIDKNNVVLFAFDPSQPRSDHWAFLAEGGFKLFTRPTVSKRGPGVTAGEALAWLEGNVDKVVVHFDLDVVDCGKYPIGNYPHHAGLHFEEAMEALKVFVGSGKLIGLVVTEVNPNNDPSGSMVGMLVDGIVEAFGKRLRGGPGGMKNQRTS